MLDMSLSLLNERSFVPGDVVCVSRLPFKPSGRTVFGVIFICAIVARFVVRIMSI